MNVVFMRLLSLFPCACASCAGFVASLSSFYVGLFCVWVVFVFSVGVFCCLLFGVALCFVSVCVSTFCPLLFVCVCFCVSRLLFNVRVNLLSHSTVVKS